MKGFLVFIIWTIGGCLAAYLGLWMFFIGGIVQVVQSCSPVDAMGIAFGVLKVLLAQFVFWVTFAGCGLIGTLVYMILGEGDGKKRK
jgi:hypothetical protein